MVTRKKYLHGEIFQIIKMIVMIKCIFFEMTKRFDLIIELVQTLSEHWIQHKLHMAFQR